MRLRVKDNQTEISECHRPEDMERITLEPVVVTHVALRKLVHLLSHQMFVECLLCARLCSSGSEDPAMNITNKVP